MFDKFRICESNYDKLFISSLLFASYHLNMQLYHRSRFSGFLLCVLLIAVCASPVFSQISKLSNPLEAGRIQIPDRWGVLIGAGFNTQSGTFTSACNCEFTNGRGAGLVVGVLWEKFLSDKLVIGARLTLENRSVRAAFREYETVSLSAINSPGTRFDVPILFRHIGDATFSMVALTPYIQWYPSGRFFLSAGLQPHFITGSGLKHTKELVDESTLLPNGELALLQFTETGSSSLVLQDTEFPQAQSFQFAVTLTTGYDIRLSRSLYVTPMLQYVIPFTSLSPATNDFRISSLQLLLAVKTVF